MAGRAGGSIKSGLILILFILGHFTSLNALEPVIAPELQITEPVFAFGEVSEGQPVVARFVLQNRGNAHLIIQRIVTGCGCTTAISTNGDIAPGEQAVVTVEFDTEGFSGPQSRVVRIYSNDLVSPVLLLRLEGTISSPVAFAPDRIELGEISRHLLQSVEKEFAVKIVDEDVVIESVASYSPYVRVEETKAGSKNERFFILRFSGEQPAARFRDRIVVSFGGSRSGTFNIPIFGTLTEASDL